MAVQPQQGRFAWNNDDRERWFCDQSIAESLIYSS